MRLFGALLLSASVAVTACGDTGDASGCVEVREPLDPLSIQHVIDADSVAFLTDPPTSGPHLSGPSPAGLLEAPLPAAAQVRVLEAGGVVVQYTSAVDGEDLRSLAENDDFAFVVAPADSLPSPVVATAWTWKLACENPQLNRILDFASERSLDAPGED